VSQVLSEQIKPEFSQNSPADKFYALRHAILQGFSFIKLANPIDTQGNVRRLTFQVKCSAGESPCPPQISSALNVSVRLSHMRTEGGSF